MVLLRAVVLIKGIRLSLNNKTQRRKVSGRAWFGLTFWVKLATMGRSSKIKQRAIRPPEIKGDLHHEDPHHRPIRHRVPHHPGGHAVAFQAQAGRRCFQRRWSGHHQYDDLR